MNKILKILVICLLFFNGKNPVCGENLEKKIWTYTNGNYQLDWDFTTDKARMFMPGSQKTIWQGSLLPAFWLQETNGQKKYVKAVVLSETTSIEKNETKWTLQLADLGTGSISFKKESWGISVVDFQVRWNDQVPQIIDLYFGTSPVPEGRQSLMDENNPPFSSDWDAFGYCIPGAKEGPVQSYFRFWDFGQTNIALGSFGPSMGTPYGAAFPRPILSLAMGTDQGWMVIGAGCIPDAPMTLKIRSSLGCLDYLYREDIWGDGGKERLWKNPLRLTFGENAWLAYRQYFHSFPEKEALSSIHQKAIWNTWGNWRNKEYPIRPMGDFAKVAGAEIFIVDDPWEASQGLGKPDTVKFPDIFGDLEYIHKNKMSHGIWETVGYIGDTIACGLGKADLICDKNGIPCIGNWNFNPFLPGYFCMDISSQHTRNFLKARTIKTMKTMKPKLIKLDFGYGLPNPNIGVPRNPDFRGEKYSFELIKIISEAAKSVDPAVTIMYYGINPLYLSPVDMISLDDQGDMWYAIKAGHDQWSIWASLLSDKQVAISGSSSYDWQTDDEVILNTFILGSPGAVLATHLDDGSPVPEKQINRRLAINKWFRKTIQWDPVWLNSHLGDFSKPPRLNCWGRCELIDGKNQITAIVLNGEKDKSYKELDNYEWEGRWAVISLDQQGIDNSGEFVVVPFDKGFISIALSSKPKKILKVNTQSESLWEEWSWNEGKLSIKVDEKLLCKTAGFKIKMK